MDLTDFLLIGNGAKLVKYGNCEIGVKRANSIYHVYLNGINVVSYTTFTECAAFIDGVENAVKTENSVCYVIKTENK